MTVEHDVKKLDLATGNDGANVVSVLLGQGNGDKGPGGEHEQVERFRRQGVIDKDAHDLGVEQLQADVERPVPSLRETA